MNYLAIDLGAGSGRLILGRVCADRIDLQEIHRFDNRLSTFNGHTHWNFPQLLEEIKIGIKKAIATESNIAAIGVDTWGVDYGLIDANGSLIGLPYSYRDNRTLGTMKEMFAIIPQNILYKETGNQLMEINTLFQLFAQQKNQPYTIQAAEKLLFTPDLINFALTGVARNEYTIASTSQMLHAAKRKWNERLLDQLGIPSQMLGEIVAAGTVIGTLSESICKELNCPAIEVVAVGSHDTASAVAAVPADDQGEWAFLSSGTWSLMGTLLEEPIMTEEAMKAHFTNEGAVDGRIRFLSNITGLWLLQNIVREFEEETGKKFDYNSVIAEATRMTDFATIDPDNEAFRNPDSMRQAIATYCHLKGINIPRSEAQFMRIIVCSLVEKYRDSFIQMCQITGKKITQLHIIGGGSQNTLLNQLTAQRLGVKVIAGPVEATALGNILAQAIGKGEISSFAQGRDLIRKGCDLQIFMPDKK